MDARPLVLVADDEPQITKLVAMTLTEEGFRVITARDGEEALDRVASQRRTRVPRHHDARSRRHREMRQLRNGTWFR